jgi:hypothetical protein
VTEKSATPVLLAAIKGRQTMKYICLGYYDKSKHDAMTETGLEWPARSNSVRL